MSGMCVTVINCGVWARVCVCTCVGCVNNNVYECVYGSNGEVKVEHLKLHNYVMHTIFC